MHSQLPESHRHTRPALCPSWTQGLPVPVGESHKCVPPLELVVHLARAYGIGQILIETTYPEFALRLDDGSQHVLDAVRLCKYHKYDGEASLSARALRSRLVHTDENPRCAIWAF